MGVCESVAQAVEPVVNGLGLELWDVEYRKEGSDYFLRIYIDKPDGVSIDDCVSVNNAIDPIIDELDPIQQSYCLEVSSAGLVRELKKDSHFDRFLSKTVTVHTYKSIDGILPKKFEATLLGYNDKEIIFEIKDNKRAVERSSISKISIDLV